MCGAVDTWEISVPSAQCCYEPEIIWGFVLKILFIYFLEKEEGEEKERERNINVYLPFTRPLLGTWSMTQACALTGN